MQKMFETAEGWPATLPPQMRDPDLLNLLQSLARDGATGRFVGGCVRDALINRPITDVDIAVNRTPDAVRTILANAGIRTIPTGIDHGTLSVPLDQGNVEITSLRRDVETDGRRAVVAFTDQWEEDAARRDFTINALYCDADGRLYDYHNGLEDLNARHIRFIGDPEQRIQEDVLRILRFFRFHAQLGVLTPDPMGLAACSNSRDLLPALSAERVAVELKKILESPDPAPMLIALQTGGFLTHWLPELQAPEDLEYLESSDGLMRLALLILPEDVDPICDRLKLSVQNRRRLHAALRVADAPESDAAARAMLYRDGTIAARDRAHLGLARGQLNWSRTLSLVDAWDAPLFPIKGADARAAGFHPGPELGAALKSLEEAWIASDFTLAASDLRSMLQALGKAGGRGEDET